MTEITLIQKGFKIDEDVKAYIEEKLLKHKKLLAKATNINVLIKFNKSYPPNMRYRMEIAVAMPHTFIKVEDRASSPTELVDILEVTLKRKITRYNQQFKKWEKHEPWKVKETNKLLPTMDSEDENFFNYEPNVKKETIDTTRAMHVGEAIERLEMSGRNAYLFKNLKSDSYAMLFRSPNQEYIIIETNE